MATLCSFFFCAAVTISLFPRSSGSSTGTFLVAGRQADCFYCGAVQRAKSCDPVPWGKKAITNPYHIAAPPAQQDQWRHLSPIMLTLNQQGTPSSREERAPPCVGYCCLPVGQSGPPFLPLILEEAMKCSVAYGHRLAPSPQDGQGRDPARIRCARIRNARLSSPGSTGRARDLRTLRLRPTSSAGRQGQGWVLEPFPGSREKAGGSCLFVPTFTQGWDSSIWETVAHLSLCCLRKQRATAFQTIPFKEFPSLVNLG